MTIFFVNQFKDYSYGDNLAFVTENIASRQRLSTPANKPGRRSVGSLRDYVQFTLEGTLQAADPDSLDDFRDAWDVFKAAHDFGVSGNLYLDDDRYMLVEVTGNIQAEKSKGLTYRNWSVTLTSYDPYWFDQTPTTVSSLNTDGSDNTIDVDGNAITFPIITIDVSAVSADPDAPSSVDIIDALGNEMRLYVRRTGTFVVDCLNETITCDAVDRFDETFDGIFTELKNGSNNLVITNEDDTNLTIDSCSLSYQNRWC